WKTVGTGRAAAAVAACLIVLSGAGVVPAARAQEAGAILDATAVRGGLVVHVGCGDGRLTAALRADASYLVHGLDTDASKVEKARSHVRSLGLCGKVFVEHWAPPRLPYVDNLVNLVVADGLRGTDMKEALRVLAPAGVAYVRAGGEWTKTVKPRPGGIDDWTHYLHDAGGNAVAHDTVAGPPRHMQWLAAPLWSRHHHTLASISSVVSTEGRIFHILDEGPAYSMDVPGKWSVIARDAFNGVLLWKRPMSSWAWHRKGFRSGPVQLPRTLVAVGSRVYVPLGMSEPVTALDAATGKTVMTYKQTAGAEELIVSEGVLLVVTGSPMAEQAGVDPALRGKATYPNTKAVVALRAETGEQLWRWSNQDANPVPMTLAAEGPRVFFQSGGDVVCLDRETGKELWTASLAAPVKPKPAESAKPAKGAKARKPRAKRKGVGGTARSVGWSVATLVVHDGVVLLADAGKLSALSAKDGNRLWSCPGKPGFRSPSDVFVTAGPQGKLVWCNPGVSEGRDLRTGEVKKTNPALADLWTAGHHHRCFREKATD
ncbi:MAG: PQQ-binding-like beta-propeller repeat protein, partial [Phycisphaerae bacterium]